LRPLQIEPLPYVPPLSLSHSVALFAMYYNFVRIRKTLRTTPAMAAKVTERL